MFAYYASNFTWICFALQGNPVKESSEPCSITFPILRLRDGQPLRGGGRIEVLHFHSVLCVRPLGDHDLVDAVKHPQVGPLRT